MSTLAYGDVVLSPRGPCADPVRAPRSPRKFHARARPGRSAAQASRGRGVVVRGTAGIAELRPGPRCASARSARSSTSARASTWAATRGGLPAAGPATPPGAGTGARRAAERDRGRDAGARHRDHPGRRGVIFTAAPGGYRRTGGDEPGGERAALHARRRHGRRRRRARRAPGGDRARSPWARRASRRWSAATWRAPGRSWRSAARSRSPGNAARPSTSPATAWCGSRWTATARAMVNSG